MHVHSHLLLLNEVPEAVCMLKLACVIGKNASEVACVWLMLCTVLMQNSRAVWSHSLGCTLKTGLTVWYSPHFTGRVLENLYAGYSSDLYRILAVIYAVLNNVRSKKNRGCATDQM